jgi:hypothetical protein
MKLYIDYLTNEDRESQFYLKFLNEFDHTIEYIQAHSRDEFLESLQNKDFRGFEHLAIKTHGSNNSDHICKDSQMLNAISYQELVNTLNTINCQNLKLNLMGICHSIKIEQYLINLDRIKFSEVWVSLNETENISAAVETMKYGFDSYMDCQEPDTYAKFINTYYSPNWVKVST